MRRGLYEPGGFYTTQEPRRHFDTSSRSPLFARAIAALAREVDARLQRPQRFTLVDMGAGSGELLHNLLDVDDLDGRLELVGVDVRPRPPLDPRIEWRHDPPGDIVGMVVACEWLDNVPLDVAVRDNHGRARLQLVDPVNGETAPGPAVDAPQQRWLDTWWPHGRVAEIGLARDRAWASLTRRLRRGCALAVDYGHTAADRPSAGTLTGYLEGKQTEPIPDGSRDITAHVAFDSLGPGSITTQDKALRSLGIDGTRPNLELARNDPSAYLGRLSTASEAARLTDRGGLGRHLWLRHDK